MAVKDRSGIRCPVSQPESLVAHPSLFLHREESSLDNLVKAAIPRFLPPTVPRSSGKFSPPDSSFLNRVGSCYILGSCSLWVYITQLTARHLFHRSSIFRNCQELVPGAKVPLHQLSESCHQSDFSLSNIRKDAGNLSRLSITRLSCSNGEFDFTAASPTRPGWKPPSEIPCHLVVLPLILVLKLC